MNLNVEKLNVLYNEKKVGILKALKDGRIAFQYDLEWLENGFSISPFSLPLKDEVFISNSPYFKGLYGVFFDSLPDGWGEYLVRRMFRSKGINFEKVSILTRLSILNYSSLGAFEFIPNQVNKLNFNEIIDLDIINEYINKELKDNKNEPLLDDLYKLGGASGGSRPKVHLNIEGEEWIVKFPAINDSKNSGFLEFTANKLAKNAKINVNEHKLFNSQVTNGFFGAKRFDRIKGRKVHTISVAALLETTPKISNLDYYHIFQIIEQISIDKNDVLEMFRRMVFNVLYGNKDDHSKNHAFIYDESQKGYRLSKAYDITKTEDKLEHEITVNGKGNPKISDLYEMARKVNLRKEQATTIIEEVVTTLN